MRNMNRLQPTDQQEEAETNPSYMKNFEKAPFRVSIIDKEEWEHAGHVMESRIPPLILHSKGTGKLCEIEGCKRQAYFECGQMPHYPMFSCHRANK